MIAPTAIRSTLPSRIAPRGAEALAVLFETRPVSGSAVRAGLPGDLAQRYAGDLSIPLRADRPAVIANFVGTIDGAVALDRGGRSGGGEVSGFSPTDRFVMGLLRAFADVVLVGAGTVRASKEAGWTPSRIHPEAAASYRELRLRLGLAPEPITLIVTAGGNLDPDHPAFGDPNVPIVLAGSAAASDRLRRMSFPANVRIESVGEDANVPAEALVKLAGRMDARVILTEGGPHLIGGFAAAGLLDELFLTIAPQLVGRDRDTERLALIEGTSLWPDRALWGDLVSVRRAGDHLFLRYRFPEAVS